MLTWYVRFSGMQGWAPTRYNMSDQGSQEQARGKTGVSSMASMGLSSRGVTEYGSIW